MSKSDISESARREKVIAALRAGQPLNETAREQLACILEKKNPPHRPRQSHVPYNNKAILDLVFGFMRNFQIVEKLRAGEMPGDGDEFDQQYADATIASLAPHSAKNPNQAFELTVSWLAQRGVKVTKNKVSKLYYVTLQDHAASPIDSPKKWEEFLNSEAEKQLLK